MKGLITVFLLSLPAASQAMGMRGGAGDCGGISSYLMATALSAAIAALGYWVLQHADKETHNCVKRTGLTVGAALVVLGLLGLLCGVAHHVKMAASPAACGGGSSPGMRGEMPMQPPGHPPAGMMKGMPMPPPGNPPDEKTKKPEAGSKKNGG